MKLYKNLPESKHYLTDIVDIQFTTERSQIIDGSGGQQPKGIKIG